MGLEGATLVWAKVVGLKPDGIRYLFYALWPEKRVAVFFGIFEKEDGTKYVEDVSEMEDIQKLAPGMMREVFENLFNATFKPWWKVW
jgi:cytochrome b